MKLTKEQEEYLNEQLEIHRTETRFTCVDCGKSFNGMDEVHKHVDEKKHYQYKSPNCRGILGIL